VILGGAMANEDTKIWNLSNVIITIMAGVISVFIGLGFSSLGNKIETGDGLINSRLTKIEDGQRTFSDCIMQMKSDITRMDTLQKMRLEREIRDENRRNGVRP
jgi:hypothetical protein